MKLKVKLESHALPCLPGYFIHCCVKPSFSNLHFILDLAALPHLGAQVLCAVITPSSPLPSSPPLSCPWLPFCQSLCNPSNIHGLKSLFLKTWTRTQMSMTRTWTRTLGTCDSAQKLHESSSSPLFFQCIVLFTYLKANSFQCSVSVFLFFIFLSLSTDFCVLHNAF